MSHTRDIGLTTYSSLDSRTPEKSGLPVFKGLTRQLSAETSNVTGILEQLNARFLSWDLPMKISWADRRGMLPLPSGENISLFDKLLLIAKESQGPYYQGYAAGFRAEMLWAIDLGRQRLSLPTVVR